MVIISSFYLFFIWNVLKCSGSKKLRVSIYTYIHIFVAKENVHVFWWLSKHFLSVCAYICMYAHLVDCMAKGQTGQGAGVKGSLSHLRVDHFYEYNSISCQGDNNAVVAYKQMYTHTYVHKYAWCVRLCVCVHVPTSPLLHVTTTTTTYLSSRWSSEQQQIKKKKKLN